MARASRPGPIQAIVGEDTYLAEEALERVLAAAIGEERQDALQVLYATRRNGRGPGRGAHGVALRHAPGPRRAARRSC